MIINKVVLTTTGDSGVIDYPGEAYTYLRGLGGYFPGKFSHFDCEKLDLRPLSAKYALQSTVTV